MPQTTIIAFEGIDGSGKTVQLNKLQRTLTKRGMAIDSIAFPQYSGFFGREIGKYLTAAEGVSALDVDSKSMALWFALDRLDAFRSYKDGLVDVLLINRYVLSNAVYQSIRKEAASPIDMFDFVMELEHERFCLPRPDAYIYLDINTQEAGENVVRKGYREYSGNSKDVYEMHNGIQRNARAKYIEYASLLKNVFVISCMQNGKLRSEKDISIEIETRLMQAGLI